MKNNKVKQNKAVLQLATQELRRTGNTAPIHS
jgi:hypothetical protein